MIRAVLFDYGGTLVRPLRPWEEAKPAAVAAPYNLLRRRGLEASFSEYMRFNDSIFEMYTELDEQTGSDTPDIVKYREIVAAFFPNRPKAWRERVAISADNVFWDAFAANFVLQKGARRCLAELRSKKLKQAVVSNHHNEEALYKHLTKLGLKSYFSPIIVSSRVGFRKPDLRIFAMCLSTLRVHAPEAVFVGDSMQYDVEGAKRAGMTTILIGDDGRSYKRSKPDFTVASLSEVPEIVSSL